MIEETTHFEWNYYGHEWRIGNDIGTKDKFSSQIFKSLEMAFDLLTYCQISFGMWVGKTLVGMSKIHNFPQFFYMSSNQRAKIRLRKSSFLYLHLVKNLFVTPTAETHVPFSQKKWLVCFKKIVTKYWIKNIYSIW